MDIGNKDLPVLVFSLRETLYIISVKYVRYIEILPEQIVDLPGSPDYLRGMCSYNNDDITLIGLDELLFGRQGETSGRDADKMVIVVNDVGFIVKRILGIESPNMFFCSDDNLMGGKMVEAYSPSSEIRDKYRGFFEGNVVLEPNILRILDLIQNQRSDKEDGNEDNYDLP